MVFVRKQKIGRKRRNAGRWRINAKNQSFGEASYCRLPIWLGRKGAPAVKDRSRRDDVKAETKLSRNMPLAHTLSLKTHRREREICAVHNQGTIAPGGPDLSAYFTICTRVVYCLVPQGSRAVHIGARIEMIPAAPFLETPTKASSWILGWIASCPVFRQGGLFAVSPKKNTLLFPQKLAGLRGIPIF